jgi:hypothetical protein
VSRKRHRLISRPVSGAKLRYAKWARPRSLLFDMAAFSKAWSQPAKPFKHKRKGWIVPKWDPQNSGVMQFEMILEYGHPEAQVEVK